MAESAKTVLEAYKDALSQSATIRAWCEAAYGRAQKVYVGIDGRQPPEAADCPFIWLEPVSCSYGRGVTEKITQLALYIETYDEEYVQDPETNAVQFLGVQRCMDLLDLAVAAIAAVSTGNALLQDIRVEFETVESFPFFMVACPLMLAEPFTLGATRTTL